MNHPARIALLACISFALAACSKGPSDDEVRTALKARIGEAGADAKVSLGDVDHIHCYKREGGSKYSCSFVAEMSVMGRSTKSSGQLEMVKVGDAWTFEPGQALSMRSQ